jgi:hypothetical protein
MRFQARCPSEKPHRETGTIGGYPEGPSTPEGRPCLLL